MLRNSGERYNAEDRGGLIQVYVRPARPLLRLDQRCGSGQERLVALEMRRELHFLQGGFTAALQVGHSGDHSNILSDTQLTAATVTAIAVGFLLGVLVCWVVVLLSSDEETDVDRKGVAFQANELTATREQVLQWLLQCEESDTCWVLFGVAASRRQGLIPIREFCAAGAASQREEVARLNTPPGGSTPSCPPRSPPSSSYIERAKPVMELQQDWNRTSSSQEPPYMVERCEPAPSAPAGGERFTVNVGPSVPQTAETRPVVQFSTFLYFCHRGQDTVVVDLMRTGDLTCRSMLRYRTKDLTAKAGSQYVAAEGTVVFEPGEEQKDIHIMLVGESWRDPSLANPYWDPTVEFEVEIVAGQLQNAQLGRYLQKARVKVIDTDGYLQEAR